MEVSRVDHVLHHTGRLEQIFEAILHILHDALPVRCEPEISLIIHHDRSDRAADHRVFERDHFSFIQIPYPVICADPQDPADNIKFIDSIHPAGRYLLPFSALIQSPVPEQSRGRRNIDFFRIVPILAPVLYISFDPQHFRRIIGGNFQVPDREERPIVRDSADFMVPARPQILYTGVPEPLVKKSMDRHPLLRSSIVFRIFALLLFFRTAGILPLL